MQLNKSLLYASVFALSSIFSSTCVSAQTIEALENLLNNGEHAQLLQTINTIPRSQYTEEHYMLHVFALADDDLDDAEEMIDEAVKAFPQSAELHMNRASIMGAQASQSIFSALGYAEKALDSLEIAASLEPNNPDTQYALMMFHTNAPSIAGGDLGIALKQAQKVQALDPERGTIAMYNYLRADDRKDEALASILDAKSDFADSSSIQNVIASHYVREEAYEQAIAEYNVLTAMSLPSLVENDEDSLETYERALRRKLNAHYQLARLAKESKSHIEMGIEHMEYFLAHVDQKHVKKNELPSVDWANMRLAELYVLANNKTKASEAYARIDADSDKDLKKPLKKLKKALKKLS